MPLVNGKRFPYTKAGIMAATKAQKSVAPRKMGPMLMKKPMMGPIKKRRN